MAELTSQELLFFAGKPEALPLYTALREGLLARCPGAVIQVKKTQISFAAGHLFAAVSFAPVRRAAQRPDPYITVTFGLPHRLDHPRIDAAAEPYPGRWTHHVLLGSPQEADQELLGFLEAAAAFSAAKGCRGKSSGGG